MMRQMEQKTIRTVIEGIIYALFAAGLFYLVEAYEHNPFAEVRFEAAIFNIILMELLAWSLFFLIGNAKIAMRVLAGVVMLFGLVNHYVMLFRSTPFVPWDLLSIKTAGSVAGEYNYMPSIRVIVVSIGFVAIMVGVHWISMKWKRRMLIRLGALVTSIAILCGFTACLQSEDFQNEHALYPFLFTPAYMTKVNGMMVTFTMNLAYLIVEKPSNYSKETAQNVLDSYESKKAPEQELPNIIVIMDEAFSDLQVVSDFVTNEDYMPFMHAMQQGAENAQTGYANVSVCGGNTANSEFEFLTGNTMAFLPTGSIPYQQYVKGEVPSLASHLQSLGYRTYGMHPYYASGWNRDRVYPLLGIENSLFQDDFTDKKYLRKYVDDASDFENIKRIYEENEGKPVFIFNVTMQNHSSYTEAFSNFVPDVEAMGSQDFALKQYLSLIKKSDQALKDLVAYLAASKEKTLLVFFGDHQPNDYVADMALRIGGRSVSELTEEEQKLRYQVPYLIWANYDIEEAKGKDTSLNYLAAEALKTGGIPTSAYQNYLLELKQQYPVVSAVTVESKDGKQSDKEWKKALREYQCLQYYQLMDWERK